MTSPNSPFTDVVGSPSDALVKGFQEFVHPNIVEIFTNFIQYNFVQNNFAQTVEHKNALIRNISDLAVQAFNPPDQAPDVADYAMGLLAERLKVHHQANVTDSVGHEMSEAGINQAIKEIGFLSTALAQKAIFTLAQVQTPASLETIKSIAIINQEVAGQAIQILANNGSSNSSIALSDIAQTHRFFAPDIMEHLIDIHNETYDPIAMQAIGEVARSHEGTAEKAIQTLKTYGSPGAAEQIAFIAASYKLKDPSITDIGKAALNELADQGVEKAVELLSQLESDDVELPSRLSGEDTPSLFIIPDLEGPQKYET